MILIADSGSTKTDWCITDTTDNYRLYKTEGINPFLQDEDYIARIIKKELLPYINNQLVDQIYFYGAGCTEEKSIIVRNALITLFGENVSISVKSDLYGAAIALCGNSAGIACILGTGSNSCEFDGKEITKHTSPLGFILGDEGGGAYIGKRFISDCIKGQLPKHIYDEFLERYHLTEAEIINHVYREKLPNRFLASFSLFIGEKRHEKAVHDLLVDCFCQFFKRNIMEYDISKDVNIIGSIAFYFEDEVKEAAKLNGIRIGKIIKAPIEGLIDYYSHAKGIKVK